MAMSQARELTLTFANAREWTTSSACGEAVHY